MDDRNRLRLEALIRIKEFMDNNAGDFATGAAAVQRAILNNAIAIILAAGAEQMAGFGSAAAAFNQKATSRENLRDEVSDISSMARAMEHEFNGIANMFRFERNLSDQALIATAKAFHTQSAAYETNFVHYGLPAAFRTELKTAFEDFESAVSTAAGFVGEHVEATEDFSQAIRQGMIAKRILDAIVKQIYAADPGKLAAWFSASHVEKSPKKKTPPTP